MLGLVRGERGGEFRADLFLFLLVGSDLGLDVALIDGSSGFLSLLLAAACACAV